MKVKAVMIENVHQVWKGRKEPDYDTMQFVWKKEDAYSGEGNL